MRNFKPLTDAIDAFLVQESQVDEERLRELCLEALKEMIWLKKRDLLKEACDE